MMSQPESKAYRLLVAIGEILDDMKPDEIDPSIQMIDEYWTRLIHSRVHVENAYV